MTGVVSLCVDDVVWLPPNQPALRGKNAVAAWLAVLPEHRIRRIEIMISLGLHLDNCGQENGALRVLSGPPTHGRIPEDQIAEIRDGTVEHICKVAMGGVFLMRPLLLHSSSRVPGHHKSHPHRLRSCRFNFGHAMVLRMRLVLGDFQNIQSRPWIQRDSWNAFGLDPRRASGSRCGNGRLGFQCGPAPIAVRRGRL
jgi:hypothetical protein